MRTKPSGWLTLELGRLEQTIQMRGDARNFGGVHLVFHLPRSGAQRFRPLVAAWR